MQVLDDPGQLRESVRALLKLDLEVLLLADGTARCDRALDCLQELVDGFPS